MGVVTKSMIRCFLIFVFLALINAVKAYNTNIIDQYLKQPISDIGSISLLSAADSLIGTAKTDDEKLKAYMFSANIHQSLGNRAFAINNAIYADEIANATLNPSWQAITALFLATSFRHLGLLDASKRYLERAFRANEISHEHTSYTLTKVKILHESSFQAIAKNEYKEAFSDLINVKSLINSKDQLIIDNKIISANNYLLGLWYLKNRKYNEAQRYYSSALEILNSDESNIKPYIYKGLAEVALRIGELEKVPIYLAYTEPYLDLAGYEDLSLDVYETFVEYNWEIEDHVRVKEYNLLFISLKNKKITEDNLIVGQIYENMYASKELFRSQLKTGLAIILCFIVIIVFLVLYVFLLSKKNIVVREKSQNQGYINDTSLETNITHSRTKSINISKETEQRLLEDFKKYEKDLFFLDKKTSLASIARDLNTNQRYVSYIIRKYKGKDFYNFIQASRIKFVLSRIKADPLLLDYKLSELADLAGFSSLSQFSIAFKAETGMPPSAFVHFTKNDLKLQ